MQGTGCFRFGSRNKSLFNDGGTITGRKKARFSINSSKNNPLWNKKTRNILRYMGHKSCPYGECSPGSRNSQGSFFVKSNPAYRRKIRCVTRKPCIDIVRRGSSFSRSLPPNPNKRTPTPVPRSITPRRA